MSTHDGEFMRASDAFSWYQEGDPALRATIVAVIWLDRRPDWATLRDTVDAATRVVPKLRQRVQPALPWITRPRWVLEENFDLSWHLRCVDVPAPHTPAAVLDLARIEMSTAFDRSRPLWTFTLVDGLTHERAALIMKVHHSLTDGVGAMELGRLLFDPDRTLRTDPVPPAPAARHAPLVAAVATRVLGQSAELVGGTLRAVPRALGSLRDPVGAAREVFAAVRSIGATVAPVWQTLSPVMRERGIGRHAEVITVDLAELKHAASVAHATINDAFLAGVTGGLRIYHEQHDTVPEQLRVTMPISIRADDDPAASNRITLLRFPLPVSTRDPLARMRAIGRRCRAARGEPSLAFTDAIAGGLDLLPTGLVGSLLKHVDFLASDVRGPAVPVYLAGAEVTAYCAFGPTLGSAANFTLLSYAGTCHIGVTIDDSAIVDPTAFMAALRAGFAEVLGDTATAGVALPIRDNRYPTSARSARAGRPDGPH